MRNLSERAANVAKAITNASLSTTVEAMSHESKGNVSEATRLLNEAINLDPNNSQAAFALIRYNLGNFAVGRVPKDVVDLANKITGPERATLEAWVLAAQGDFATVEQLDPILAQTNPTSLAYPVATKLRVDWRVSKSATSGVKVHARDGLEILDLLLPSFASMDLYFLRAGAARLAGDGAAFVESVHALVEQIETEFKTGPRKCHYQTRCWHRSAIGRTHQLSKRTLCGICARKS